MATLLEDFRDYLISQGVVRKPRVAGSAHPMWIEPRNGTPAPGEGENATEIDSDVVLGAYLNAAGGIPARPYEASVRTDTIEVRYRVRSEPLVEPIETAVRSAILDKFDHWLGTQRIIETQEWRTLTRVGSDTQGFEFLSSYLVWRYA